MAKIRTFIALELPEELQKAFHDLQQTLRGHTDCVRWVKPEHIHLTLKFLGSIEETQVEPIARILHNIAAQAAPFALEVSGIGAFPNARNPKVLWAGMKGNQVPIITFQQKLEAALAVIGFHKEKRGYAPHLTLGRVRENKGKRDLERLIDTVKNQDIGSFTADKIILFKSDLLPSGPVYTVLQTIQLQ